VLLLLWRRRCVGEEVGVEIPLAREAKKVNGE
jgi:hypothetical protein